MKACKRILALLAAVVLCVCLSGCDVVDEMRSAHGLWQADGSILWNDNVYRPIADYPGDLYLETDTDKKGYDVTVYVTQPDVPVLLSQMLGKYVDSCSDGVFLNGYDVSLYCRADRYDEVMTRIAEGYRLEKMLYTYEDYNEEEGIYYREYTLTAEEMQAVQEVYTTVIPTPVQDGMYFSSDYALDLWGGTTDGLFQRRLFCLELAGDTYYLTDDEAIYEVPSDYVAVFQGILKPMLDGEQRAEEYWTSKW